MSSLGIYARDEVLNIEALARDGDKAGADALAEDLFGRLGADQIELQVFRSKNNYFGAYARERAKQPVEGETERDRDVRLYGEIPPDDSAPSYGEGLARSYLAGAAIEEGDEIVAAAAAFFNKLERRNPGKPYTELYDAYRERERDQAESFANEYPVSDLTAKIVGGVFSPFWKPLSLLGRLSFIPQFLKVASPTATGWRGVGQAARGGAKLGFYGGGLYGIGMGEGLQDRAEHAALMGAAGAPFGGTLGPIFWGVGRLAHKLLSVGAERRGGRIKGAPSDVSEEVGALVAADKAAVGASERLAILGEEAMLADLGPATAGKLDQIIQAAAPGTQDAAQAIAARSERIGRALSGDLDSMLGNLEGVLTREQLKARYASAGPIYDRAYRSSIDYSTPAGNELLRKLSVVPARVVRAANALLKIESELDPSLPTAQMKIIIGDTGDVIFEKLPSVAQIDFITRGINQIARKFEGEGQMGGLTPYGRAMVDLSTRVRTLLKDLVPDYRDALALASHNITNLNAGKLGGEYLRPIHSRQDVFSAIEGLGKIELATLKRGIRQYLDDTMANVKRAMKDPLTEANTIKEAMKLVRELSSRMNRDKLSYLLRPQELEALFAGLRKQELALQLQAKIRDNSLTYARGAAERRGEPWGEVGAIRTALGGSPIQAAQKAASSLVGIDPVSLSAAQRVREAQLARVLTTSPPPPLSGIITARTRSQADAEMLGALLSGQIGPALGGLPGQIERTERMTK